MFVSNMPDAYKQAQANANGTGEVWCVFIDTSNNIRVEPENQVMPELILRRFAPKSKKGKK